MRGVVGGKYFGLNIKIFLKIGFYENETQAIFFFFILKEQQNH